jgi:hypothetical protein
MALNDDHRPLSMKVFASFGKAPPDSAAFNDFQKEIEVFQVPLGFL